MEDKLVKFESVVFDKEQKTFTIHDGTEDTYDYREIVRCSILNEDAKFRGKGKPFEHQVLGGVTFVSMLGEPSLYVGLKVVMKDESILAIYVSQTKTQVNTDLYHKDRKEAERIKHFIDQAIHKYQSVSE